MGRVAWNSPDAPGISPWDIEARLQSFVARWGGQGRSRTALMNSVGGAICNAAPSSAAHRLLGGRLTHRPSALLRDHRTVFRLRCNDLFLRRSFGGIGRETRWKELPGQDSAGRHQPCNRNCQFDFIVLIHETSGPTKKIMRQQGARARSGYHKNLREPSPAITHCSSRGK